MLLVYAQFLLYPIDQRVSLLEGTVILTTLFSVDQGRFSTYLVKASDCCLVDLDEPLVPPLHRLLIVAIQHITRALYGRGTVAIGHFLFHSSRTRGHLDATVIAAITRGNTELMESHLGWGLRRESSDFVGWWRGCWAWSVKWRQYSGRWLLLLEWLRHTRTLLLESGACHFGVFVLGVALTAPLVLLTIVVGLKSTLEENTCILLKACLSQFDKWLAHTTQMGHFFLHGRVSTIKLLSRLVVLLQGIKPEFLPFDGRVDAKLTL